MKGREEKGWVCARGLKSCREGATRRRQAGRDGGVARVALRSRGEDSQAMDEGLARRRSYGMAHTVDGILRATMNTRTALCSYCPQANDVFVDRWSWGVDFCGPAVSHVRTGAQNRSHRDVSSMGDSKSRPTNLSKVSPPPMPTFLRGEATLKR
nr:hypothetical protein CFP56_01232 [Quercus suber]